MHRFLIGLFILSPLFFSAAVIAGPLDEFPELKPPIIPSSIQEELKDMQSMQGRILLYHRAPALYELVTKVFRRVATEQEKKIAGQYVPINYVFIISNAVENAFVYSPNEKGVRTSLNLVFVTTGLLRKLIDFESKALTADEESAEFRNGINRLASVLAHELAHPLDKLVYYDRHGMSLSIESEYGARGNQAVEVQADILGSQMVREASFPEEATLDALDRVLPSDETDNAAESLVNTHPENSLRRSLIRMFLTVSRLRQGEGSVQEVASLKIQQVKKELASLGKEGGALPWSDSNDLASLASRLRRVGTLNDSVKYLEINRLLLAINREIRNLEDAGKTISNEDIKSLLKSFREVIDDDLEKIWDREDRAEALKNMGDSQELLKLPTHFESLQTLRFYQDSLLVKQMINQLPPKGDEKRADALVSLSHFMQPEIFVLNFGNDLLDHEMARLQTEKYYSGGVSKIRDVRLIKALFPVFASRLALSDRMDDQTLIENFTVIAKNNIGFPFFFTVDESRYSKRGQTLRQLRESFEKSTGKIDPVDEFFRSYVRAMAAFMYARAGDFAQLEMLMARFSHGAAARIDWDFIAKVIHKDPKEVLSHVADSFWESINPAELAFLADVIEKSNVKDVKGYQSYTKIAEWEESDENKLPVWYKHELGRSLLIPYDGKALVAARILIGPVAKYDPEILEMIYSDFSRNFLERCKSQLNSLPGIDQCLRSLETQFADAWWVRAGTDNKGQINQHISVLHLVKAVEDSALPQHLKLKVLGHLTLRQDPREVWDGTELNSGYYQWTTQKRETVEAIYHVLRRAGLVSSPSDLVKKLTSSFYYRPFQIFRDHADDQGSLLEWGKQYYQFLDRAADLLSDEFTREDLTWENIKKQVAVLQSPLAIKIDRSESNTPNIQALRDLVARRAASLASKIDLKNRMRFYLDLTASGSSRESDEFFDLHLKRDVQVKPELYTWMKGVLISKRIQSAELRLNLAKMVIKPRVDQLIQSGQPPANEIYSLISDLDMMAPQGSLARDKFIEELGWQLSLKGAELKAFVEDYKTTNWKKENPFFVNMGSAVASSIHKMSRLRRAEFLEYLMDPRGSKTGGLPEEVVNELIEQTLDLLIQEKRNALENFNREQLRAQARIKARSLQLQVEQFLRDCAPTERIPLIELVLTAGPEALLKQKGAPLSIAHEFLGYKKNSPEESMLEAYLEIIPKHEIAPSLAYLLSQAKGDKRTVVSLFELFGTVGIKFGQLSSIWQVFGPEVAKETRHLKDRAPAMTRQDIFDRMEDLLPPEWKGRIEILDIAGSASIKTVVRMKTDDGRKGVMALQPSTTQAQINSNMKMGLKYLQHLEKKNLVSQSRMLGTLISALKEQLKEETDFVIEAQKYDLAARQLKQFSDHSQKDWKGWSVEAPRLMKDLPLNSQLAFYDLAEGVTFDRLSSEDKEEVGPILVRASLVQLFRFGYFDADRHKGNWLINAKTKKIYALDFGQLEDFRPQDGQKDPRKVLIEFLQAIQGRDAKAIYSAMSEMAPDGTKVPKFTDKIKDSIDHALSQPELSDQLVGLLTSVTEAGLELHRRYSFGAMKGFLTLYGEAYVSPEVFASILKEEATGMFMRSMFGKACEELLVQ